jgi:hypothetical protein|tara:strand:+ start:347 stop:547 length:201 start_codon:yes stop_codon:yes gene_type:complete
MTDKKFIEPRELAARWSLSPRTLENWRSAGNGPAYTKISGKVLYSIADVKDFEEAGRVDNATTRQT